jgi:hypothetical protein
VDGGSLRVGRHHRPAAGGARADKAAMPAMTSAVAAMSHYLKVILDAVFARVLFRAGIVWKRTTSHNDARCSVLPRHELSICASRRNAVPKCSLKWSSGEREKRPSFQDGRQLIGVGQAVAAESVGGCFAVFSSCTLLNIAMNLHAVC